MEKLIKFLNQQLKESEQELRNINTSYEQVLKCRIRTTDVEVIETANFEAGRISIIKQIKSFKEVRND